MSAIKKYLIKKLAAKAGYSPEELPMSVSEPRLMEDLRRGLAPMLPGGPYQRGEASRLDIKFPIQIKPKTKEPSVIKKPVTEKSSDSEKIIQYRSDDEGNVQIITKGMVKLTPDGKPQRTKDGELIFKTSEKQKTKPKATRSPEENRILQEKRLDKILENPLATIKRQQVESSDDVIDIQTGKLLDDSDFESTSTFISNINKFSPTTLTRSKAVDLKGPKAKELVKTMNRLEKSEIEQNKLLSSISKTKQNAVTESDFKQVEMLTKSLNKETNSKQNKLDRAALRKYFKEKKIAEGEPVKVRPTSKKGRILRSDDPSKITALTKARTARDPDKEITVLRTVDRESNYPDDLDVDPFTATKGITTRDPAKGLGEESQLPNIVGQASDPKSPVTKLDIQADPGFARKTDQEFFDNRVQDYLDQGDDLKTARKRASDDIEERNLSELTVDQLRDKMGKGSVDSPIKMDDIKLSRSIDKGQPRSDTEGLATLVTDKLGDIRGAEYKVNKKKAGGQVGKPKRKIKTSVRGNDLVAMMYD